MPPAFVLSQDQTLRKYLTKGFSSSSIFIVRLLFSKHWFVSLGCLIFKEQGRRSRRQLIYITTGGVSLSRTFFKFFSGSFALGVDVLLSTIGYYTRLLRFRQHFFHDFLQKLFGHRMTRELALPDEHVSLAGAWWHAGFHCLAMVKACCSSGAAWMLFFYRKAHKKQGLSLLLFRVFGIAY